MDTARIQHEILDYLSGQGYLAWRNHIQGIRLNGRTLKNPNTGQPSIWAVKNGRLLGVDVKPTDGVLSPDQIGWMSRSARYGIPIIIVHDVHELIETMQELSTSLRGSGEPSPQPSHI